MLQEIEAKLKEFDRNTYYGIADRQNDWNYTVFARDKTEVSSNLTSKSIKFRVAVVRENFIDENVEEEILKRMNSLPGVRKSQEPIAYSYIKKPGTNTVVEIMEAEFVKVVKR